MKKILTQFRCFDSILAIHINILELLTSLHFGFERQKEKLAKEIKSVKNHILAQSLGFGTIEILET